MWELTRLKLGEIDPYKKDPAAVKDSSCISIEGRNKLIYYKFELSAIIRIVKLITVIVATIFTAGIAWWLMDLHKLCRQVLSGNRCVYVNKEISQNKANRIAEKKIVTRDIESFLRWPKKDCLKALIKPKYHLGGNSAIERAAFLGLSSLIEESVEFLGKSLFLSVPHPTLLYEAFRCENPEKGYFTTKKLLQIGLPMNTKVGGGTLLDSALATGIIKVAALFLRHGAIPNKDMGHKNLKDAWQEIMPENEKLFKMHFNYLWSKNEAASLPNDILKQILSFSLKIELQD